MSVRNVGHAGASWLPTLQQLLVVTCISAACPVAAGANYSEMEIDLQHHTKINPPSFWNYHYTDFLLKSNQSQWCTALSLESEGLPCIKSVRWWKGQGWLQRGTGSGGKKKKIFKKALVWSWMSVHPGRRVLLGEGHSLYGSRYILFDVLRSRCWSI